MMALLPIPYTKNWKDVFGSQFIPTEANAGSAAFVEPPNIVSLTPGANGLVTAVVTLASTGRIDWGDGTPLQVLAASGSPTHTYSRPGNYGVKIYTDADPQTIAQRRVIVSDMPDLNFTIVPSVPNRADITAQVGLSFPVNVHWGDGNSQFVSHPSQLPGHTYEDPGTYNVSVVDSTVTTVTKPVTVDDA